MINSICEIYFRELSMVTNRAKGEKKYPQVTQNPRTLFDESFSGIKSYLTICMTVTMNIVIEILQYISTKHLFKSVSN
jgi:hypothetical protein